MKGKLMLILILVLTLSVTACANDDPDDVEVVPPVEDTETPAEDDDLPDMEDGEKEEIGEAEEDLEATDKEEDLDTEESKELSDKWPEDFMPQAPKLTGDIDLAKEEGPNKYFLEFNGITHDEASNYVEEIKDAGFTENTNEQIDSNIVKYKGMDSENNLIVFIWKEEITKLELIKQNN